ncbi:hypothetical protein ACJIZ3_003198 [Penstemon smallii]|uniref:Transmembrane protein n=1 Tax=Penstemon smallii TaxID=265156 RepID=A0ABD3U8Y5_9LAMI
MEKIGDYDEEKLNHKSAIRCAKAAILLSSIKSSTHNSSTDIPLLQKDEAEIEMLKIEYLKLKLEVKKLRFYAANMLVLCFLCLLILPIVLALI